LSEASRIPYQAQRIREGRGHRRIPERDTVTNYADALVVDVLRAASA
jgi:hypothetical protein